MKNVIYCVFCLAVLTDEIKIARPAQQADLLQFAFSGIHVISPQLFAKMSQNGAFSIIDTYLKLAAQGEKVAAFRADGCYWRDLGRPENIVQTERDLESGKISIF